MENDLQTSSRWMILQEENMNSSIREILKDKKRIVIKIGSSSLTHPETGALNLTKLEVLVREISDLHNMGKDVIVVSSGAIAVGRRAAGLGHRPSETKEKQACAAIGQARLMMIYQKLFSEYNQLAAQILMTKRTVMDNLSRFNALNTFQELLKLGAIPIVNENDTISVSELMFTDNDELSGLIASMMNVQALIILSNINGIYNGSPSNPDSSVIREIEHGKDLSNYIQASKSSFGRGGMLTKTNIARKVADEGITVIIANGKRDNILVDLLQHPDETLCTRFIPSNEPVSSVKKWIAHSEGFAKGEIHINKCATEILNSENAVSILPIGITRIEGEFEKDDIVRIMDFQGNQVGIGKVNCDARQAKEAIGKHGKKAVVHYDYLYIE